MKEVYLDYSATTPVKKEVFEEMAPYFTEHFGNPSSLYKIASESKEALNLARKRLADLINASPEEIFFTGSGTEADNWAVFGTLDAMKKKGNHMITSSIEHHAIMHTAQYLMKRGIDATFLSVDKEGIISPAELEKSINDKTVLVSLMMVNNEVGSIEPIKELALVAKKHGVLFHTDAVQALGNVPIDVKELGVDMMSLSSHKIYGPKGVGALYIRKGVRISNFVHGGAQENKKRAGTENLAGIVGFGKAAELANKNLTDHINRLTELRNYFIDRVKSSIKDVNINGSMDHRHPGNANITFNYIEGEAILLLLNEKGIYVSTGSACSSASLSPSHVLAAMGVPVEMIHGTIRFTMGDFTTKEDLDYTVEALKEIITKLREVSSVSEEKGW
ncbi:MAG TPA: cysteine desulfurase NifS [Bacillota bacterium]|nr:cysteine desulfurase NifS [Bacillota bacterium]